MLNYKKEVWEGWTVQDFIDSLQTEIAMIMGGSSYLKPFKSKGELEAYIISNQPYYKKPIPEVIEYFAYKYWLDQDDFLPTFEVEKRAFGHFWSGFAHF